MKYLLILCLAFTACNEKTQLVTRPLNKYVDTVYYSTASEGIKIQPVSRPPQTDSTLYYLRKISRQLDNLKIKQPGNIKQQGNLTRRTDSLQVFGAISISEVDTTTVKPKHYNPTRIINKAQQQISHFSDSLFRQWTFEQNLRYN